MSTIQTYFTSHQRIINEGFQKIRSTNPDSDSKGHGNEATVAEFLRTHVPNAFITTNSVIFDSRDQKSAEVDVCVCNTDQPFHEEGSLLIAEGVDFVVQVKAVVTKKELSRLVQNCATVKSLRRKLERCDLTFACHEDIPFLVERIPYVGFGFTSRIRLETVAETLYKLIDAVPLAHQPDALFIMDRGSILNFREGNGKTWNTKDGKSLRGLCTGFSGDKTLFEFVRYIHGFVPRFQRLLSPLIHYVKARPDYKVLGHSVP